MNTYRNDYTDRDGARMMADLRFASQDWHNEHPIIRKPSLFGRFTTKH